MLKYFAIKAVKRFLGAGFSPTRANSVGHTPTGQKGKKIVVENVLYVAMNFSCCWPLFQPPKLAGTKKKGTEIE